MATNNLSIIDYGMGNLLSVIRAVEHCGGEATLATTPEDIDKAEYLILPGVGAYGDGMDELKKGNLIDPIRNHAKKNRPLLGICLGMQLLMDRSEEFGDYDGLRLIEGAVIPIPDTGTDGKAHRIPHVGWNELANSEGVSWSGSILDGIEMGSSMYFVHSFMASPMSPSHRLAYCQYNGRKISAVIQNENIIGCQFHPEKSGKEGLKILKNFMTTKI